MSNWLTKEVVYTENFEERVVIVSRLVDIMAVSVYTICSMPVVTKSSSYRK